MVLEKKAVAGMRFMPGEMLYQIADVSSVWVLADVFERDIAQVKAGQKVKLEGKIVMKKRSKEEVEHLEGEGAKGVTAPVSIEATGVVIERPVK